MRFDWAATFGDAWQRWKRDHAVLLPIAGLFLFLPQLAFYLLVPPLPPLPATTADHAAMLAAAATLADWMTTNGGWALLTAAITAFGGLVVLSLYLADAENTPGAALSRSARLFPRYLLAAVVTAVPAAPLALGLLILLLPGLYIMGRLMLTAPALVAERPIGVAAAIRRSVVLTRGRGLAMTAILALSVLSALVAPAPFRLLHQSLEVGHAANPVAVALVEGIAAALAAAVGLATILIEIAIYRRLAINGT